MSLDSTITECEVWLRCAGYFSESAHVGDCWIGIEEGKISGISRSIPESCDRLALDNLFGGLYAAPLLSDTHGHVYMEPWPLKPADRARPGGKAFEDEVVDAMGRVDKALNNGIGLIRDMGDPHGINLEVKRRLADRDQPCPELIVPGPAFHRPKKYGRFLGVGRETVADIEESIRELHAQGEIDFIKIVATGIVDFANKRMNQSPQFTRDELNEVVDFSHELGYKVAAHCSGEDGLDLCIETGVDFIEHGYFITEAQIDRMVDKKLAWTPTFAPVHAQGANEECGWSEEERRCIEEILNEHASGISYGRGQNALILAGTDAGSPGVELGKGLRIELNCLATSGYDPESLLRVATVVNGNACSSRKYVSKLEAGAPATFALYEQAPWEDISNLKTLKHVLWEGKAIR